MKILITGGTGMVGSAFKDIDTNHEIIRYGSQTYNLLHEDQVCDMIYRNQPDAIIHLAARVGGVKGNSDFVADFFHENITMNTNLLNVAKNYRVPKVLSLLSTCVYPDQAVYPITEDQIHNGEPHASNFGYAYAKRMLEVHSRAIRKQYGLNYITAIPNNIYGPNDNFDLNCGHVIPAIIRKLWDSKQNKLLQPVFWGTGKPLREFTYSKDVAKALLLLVENYDDPAPINVGNTGEISIFDLVSKVADALGIDQPNELWDKSKPEGQHRKPSCNSKFMKIFPSFKYTSMNDGLKETVDWFKENYPNVRGV